VKVLKTRIQLPPLHLKLNCGSLYLHIYSCKFTAIHSTGVCVLCKLATIPNLEVVQMDWGPPVYRARSIPLTHWKLGAGQLKKLIYFFHNCVMKRYV